MSNTPTIPTGDGGNPPITDAGPPFDNPDADVILRSSDNVDFRVFKLLLSLASPVFKDMFTLPQAVDEKNGDDRKDGLPIVQMTEESKTLQTLFTMCYPTTLVRPFTAAPDKLEQVKLLLGAAMKYDVATVEKRARAWLVAPHFLETVPLTIYAIACLWNLEKEARAAARSTIGLAVLEKLRAEELDMITTKELHALLSYNKRCIANSRAYDFSVDWTYNTFKCESCGNPELSCQVGRWSQRYLQGVKEALNNETWNAKEKTRLIEIAVREARKCTTCSPQAPAKMRQFSDWIEAKMNKTISEVTLDFHS